MQHNRQNWNEICAPSALWECCCCTTTPMLGAPQQEECPRKWVYPSEYGRFLGKNAGNLVERHKKDNPPRRKPYSQRETDAAVRNGNLAVFAVWCCVAFWWSGWKLLSDCWEWCITYIVNAILSSALQWNCYGQSSPQHFNDLQFPFGFQGLKTGCARFIKYTAAGVSPLSPGCRSNFQCDLANVKFKTPMYFCRANNQGGHSFWTFMLAWLYHSIILNLDWNLPWRAREALRQHG